jgi:hypothetical protein
VKQIQKEYPAAKRFYVENVRSLTGTTTELARGMCKAGVQKGIFEEWRGFLCPNDECQRMLISQPGNYAWQADKRIRCDLCETNERDEYEWAWEDLRDVVFYKLVQKGE